MTEQRVAVLEAQIVEFRDANLQLKGALDEQRAQAAETAAQQAASSSAGGRGPSPSSGPRGAGDSARRAGRATDGDELDATDERKRARSDEGRRETDRGRTGRGDEEDGG